jgi:hypothetical protein
LAAKRMKEIYQQATFTVQYQLLSVNPGILLFEDLVWNKNSQVKRVRTNLDENVGKRGNKDI